MARQNKSRYAILGVLSLGPMSGYDVRKTIERSLANFWSESYGQIYPILRQLVQEGLATCALEHQEGRPDRRVYEITDAGREELRRWLLDPAEHDVGRVEILLKLFLAWQTPVENGLEKARDHRELHLRLLERYAEIERWLHEHQSTHPGLPYWLATLSYGRHVSRALVEWCDETIRTLEGMRSGRSEAEVES